MARRALDIKRAGLETLRKKGEEFTRREAELETAIQEAETDEERTALDAEVSQYETDLAAHTEQIRTAENEVSDLEAELERYEREAREAAEAAGRERRGERGETRGMNEITVNIRALPMNRRAFDALPQETRTAMLQREDVKTWLAQLRSMRGQNRAISGGELTIPVVMLDVIAENMYRYSKLLNRVRVRNVSGQARQTVIGTVPEAVWTEMCAAINELQIAFNQVTLDGFKVAGFIPVCNSLLEDSDINLASQIVEMLSEACGLAADKAILYGKGASYKMPMGIVTRLAQQSQPTDYPANAPAWQDLHTSNIKQIAADKTGTAFWAALMEAAGNTFTRYSRGRQFWAMNSKTYALLKSKVITFTASGDITANLFGVLPIINGDVDVLEFMPDGDIVGGYGELYLWAQREGISIESSRDVQFIQDNTVFRGKMRADGIPVIPGAFVAININGNAVTTSVAFAQDTANDVALQGIDGITVSPTFAADVTAYTATAPTTADPVFATAENAAAQIDMEYNGKRLSNGATPAYVSGTKNLVITVRNGNATRVYTVAVTKS